MNSTDIIFSPTDIQALTETYLADKREAAASGRVSAGLPLYIPSLERDQDERSFLPVQDGDLVSVIARPGNGKTSVMMRWARVRARKLREAASIGDADAARRVVVYCTWEQTIEALHAFHIAAENADLGLSVTGMARGLINDLQWEGIQAANVRRIGDPLWFIGHSIVRRAKRPVITVDELAKALLAIEGWQGETSRLRMDSVFVDYLQRIPYGNAESKVIGISGNLDRLKDAALALGTKVIVGVQARREVDERADPTPGMEDGQWTSNIEQTSDSVITLVRPAKYKEQGEEFAGVTVQGIAQMRLVIAKQKMGDSNFGGWVYFDPRYNQLEEAEIRRINPNE